ncbi:hypothetical protein V8E36_001362 [Tilletia maclaganii]
MNTPQHSALRRAAFALPVAAVRFATRTSPREPIEGVEWETISIPSRDQGRSIQAVRYFRTGSRDRQGARNVHLNFHGSGWVLYHWGSDQAFAGAVVKALDVDFLDMDYRKSPEHPFPAAHNDVEDAILHYANQDNVSNLSVSGFSAGANMAISGPAHLHEKIAQSRVQKISSISVLYPPCDWSVKYEAPSSDTSGGGLLLPAPLVMLFDSCAVVDPADLRAKRFSILQLQASEIPTDHILVVTGDADHLHDGGAKFIKAIQEGGHPDARFVSLPNAGHVFDKKPETELAKKYTEETYNSIIENIRKGWK